MTTTGIETGSGVDPDLVDMMNAVFADYRQGHPPLETVSRDDELWSSLDELGLLRLTGPEERGGSGAGWPEAVELVAAAVRNAVRIPLAEHDLLACWMLDSVGLPADSGARTVCLLDASGSATGVPWAATAVRVVVIWPDGAGFRVADVDPEALRITAGANLIGEPRDTVTADTAELPGTPVSADLVRQLRMKSALVRSVQVCAALDKILELSVEHTSTREQFGRPLSKFQAIQHLVSDIAAEAALARAATEAALAAALNSDWSAPDLEFHIAAARSCTGHAASVAVRNAHQALGAIGTTVEHRLHEYTRAALAWRSEYGSVRYWDDAALAAGTGGLWKLITG